MSQESGAWLMLFTRQMTRGRTLSFTISSLHPLEANAHQTQYWSLQMTLAVAGREGPAFQSNILLGNVSSSVKRNSRLLRAYDVKGQLCLVA